LVTVAIRGYKRQIQQLFQNLHSNSLKYNNPGIKPEITITATTINCIDAEIEIPRHLFLKSFYLMEVKDNGIGFEQSDTERIFNVFTRLHGNYEYSGTGIGLSIVRKVVENHEGFIATHGEPGKGASFKILLPC
jgi:signal transduction histidine kinase